MYRKLRSYLNHTSSFSYEKTYKKIKHMLLILCAFFLTCMGILLLASIVYFFNITHQSATMSHGVLKAKVLHFSGDEALNHSNKDILKEYDESQNTLIVGPKRVNANVIKALTASEDTLFFKHNGILPKALIRAMFQDIFQIDQSTGGSTITQQLVKNQVLTNEKTYKRKANELILSMKLERILTKDEIIYTYLNIVPFGRDYYGNNITGIGAASYSLFGIPPSSLNVAQSAYLIGLLQSPYYYTPYQQDGELKEDKFLQVGIDRQRYVLKRMYVENKISKKNYQKALNYDIKIHLLQKPYSTKIK